MKLKKRQKTENVQQDIGATVMQLKHPIKTIKQDCRPKNNLVLPQVISGKNFEDIIGKNLVKYWYQRYDIFSKFDDGILLDEESWYSVNLEKIATHIMHRCQNNIFLDIFCGAGGNVIQAAFKFLYVLGVDNDFAKLLLNKNNSQIYKTSEYIDLICGNYDDILKLFRRPFIDVLFIDLPWGGPNYLHKKIIDCLDPNFSVINLEQALKLSIKQTPNIIIKLPRNTSLKSIGVLSQKQPFEIEKNYLRGRLKGITVYYGNLIKNKKSISNKKGNDKTSHCLNEEELLDISCFETDETFLNKTNTEDDIYMKELLQYKNLRLNINK